MSTPRQATIYRLKEIASSNSKLMALTRGSSHRGPDNLKDAVVDIQSGRFWVTRLPEWFLDKNYEAFLELTASSKIKTGGSYTDLSYPFKEEVKVSDGTFSKRLQSREVLSGIVVGSTGIELRIALNEIDKVDKNKFSLIQKFIEETKLAELAKKVAPATGLPVNPEEIISTFFKTVELLDALNEDDVVWEELPKLDLRKNSDSPLYEGWYAVVMTPKKASQKLPLDLFLSGGELFTEYTDEKNNVPFKDQTYLTWQIIKQ
jgi:hypothetical protein